MASSNACGRSGAIGVRGNHDAAAVGGSEIEWFNPDARRAMEWTRTALAPATRDWLAALPERRTMHGLDLVHGSPREPIWEYITSARVAPGEPRRVLGSPVGLHGHTHVPVAWIPEGDRVELYRPTRDG